MKKKSKFIEIANDPDFSIKNIEMENLTVYFTPEELGILIEFEPNGEDTDILLENMLHYCEKNELYEYCQVIFDEMTGRKISV